MLMYVILFLLIGIFIILQLFKRCDGDIILMLAEKFGRKIDSLSGQVVWLTGASSGIGEALAYELAEAGCKLVLSARKVEELERVKEACLKLGKSRLGEDDILVLQLDIVDFKSHGPAVQKVLDHFNQVDILINNAGVSQRASWMDVDLEVDKILFEVNAFGPVSLTQQVLPHMIARKKGHIAINSSLASKGGIPNSRSYNASKSAVNSYFDSLRSEMDQFNIGVTLVCAGPVFSNLFINAATDKVGVLVNRKMESSEKRMSTKRCAYLFCVALANGLYETWISQQPILSLAYLAQYLPDLGRWVLMKYGLKQIHKMREGK